MAQLRTTLFLVFVGFIVGCNNTTVTVSGLVNFLKYNPTPASPNFQITQGSTNLNLATGTGICASGCNLRGQANYKQAFISSNVGGFVLYAEVPK